MQTETGTGPVRITRAGDQTRIECWDMPEIPHPYAVPRYVSAGHIDFDRLLTASTTTYYHCEWTVTLHDNGTAEFDLTSVPGPPPMSPLDALALMRVN